MTPCCWHSPSHLAGGLGHLLDPLSVQLAQGLVHPPLEREGSSLLPVVVPHQGIWNLEAPLKTCLGSKSLTHVVGSGCLQGEASLYLRTVSSSEGPVPPFWLYFLSPGTTS